MSDQCSNELVASVLSRLIGSYRSRDGKDLDQVVWALRCYAGEESKRVSPRGAARVGMRRLGTSRAELNDQWEELHYTAFETARFPDHVLVELIDPETWPVLAGLIADGPRVAARKVESVLYRYSKVEVAPSAARPHGGRLARQSVLVRQNVYRRMMKILVDLRGLEYPCDALGPWAAVPPLRLPDMAPTVTDRSAPSLDLVRAVVQRLDAEIDQRLGAIDGDKVTAIARLATAPLWQAAVVERLRHLTIIALLATLAPRVGALSRLRVEDFDPEHRFPDGEIGPALRFFPGKTVHAKLARWKGLGDMEAHLVCALILLRRRLYTERVPAERGSWRVLNVPREMPEGAALLGAKIFDPVRLPNPEAISAMLAGQSNGYAKLPLPQYLDNPSPGRHGHAAHRGRHFGDQLVRLAIEKQFEQTGVRHISSAAIADIALDHNVKEDRYGYADLNSERSREIWIRTAARAGSQMLWTDAGARRVPDLVAYQAVCAERKRLTEALTEAVARKKRIRIESENLSQPSVELLQRVILAQDEYQDLLQECDALESRQRRLESDHSTWIVVAPGSPRDSVEADPARALARVRAEIEAESGNALRLVRRRSFLTVAELAGVLDISEPSARRLVKRTPGRGRWVFRAEDPPLDETRGPRRRRVWVGGLTPDVIEARSARLDRVLSEAPKGWGAADVDALLLLPEPYATWIGQESPDGSVELAPTSLATSPAVDDSDSRRAERWA